MPIPPLIDHPTFARVREQLEKNKSFSSRNLRRDGEYLLRCLVKCGICGRGLVAHSYGRHSYYHCSGNLDHVRAGRARRCPAAVVYAPDLDSVVWKEIDGLLRSPTLMREAWERQRGHGLHNPDTVEVEIERLGGRIGDAERQICRLVDGYQQGWVRSSELARRRGSLEQRIAHWAGEREHLEQERPKWREMQAISDSLSRFSEEATKGLDQLDFSEKQSLLRKIIERVEVTACEVKVKLAVPLSTSFDLTSHRIHRAQALAPVFPVRPQAARRAVAERLADGARRVPRGPRRPPRRAGHGGLDPDLRRAGQLAGAPALPGFLRPD